MYQLALDEKLVIRAADDFAWADEMAHDQVKEITTEEGKTEGTLSNLQMESQGTTALCILQTREGDATCNYDSSNEKSRQAMEIQDTIIETQQQQKHKNKKDKKRKPNHTIEWIQERLALITQLDGTGGHEPPSKMA
jgi:hypothetical protein